MKVGIKADLNYMDSSDTYGTPFQAVLSMVITGADPDYACRVWYSKDKETNLASYNNKFVDELVELGRQTMDIEKRSAIYHRIHKTVHDDYPAIFLFSGREFIGSNYRFRDPRFSSVPHFLTTMKNWQIVDKEKEGIDYGRQQSTGVVS